MRLTYIKKNGKLLHGEELVGYVHFVKSKEPLLRFHFIWRAIKIGETTYHNLFVWFPDGGFVHIYVEH